MRMIVRVLLVALLALGLAACQQEQPKPKPSVGVVDMETVFKTSQGGKDAVAHLETIGKSLETEFGRLQEIGQNAPENVELQQQLGTIFQGLQKSFEGAQQEDFNVLNESYLAALEKCRVEAGMLVVLNKQAVQKADPSVDLTDKVIAEMNKTKIAFKEFKLPEIPAINTNSTNSTKAAPEANATAPAPVTNSTAK